MTLKYGDIWEDLIKSHETLGVEYHLRLVAKGGSRESKQERDSAHYSSFEMGVLEKEWG